MGSRNGRCKGKKETDSLEEPLYGLPSLIGARQPAWFETAQKTLLRGPGSRLNPPSLVCVIFLHRRQNGLLHDIRLLCVAAGSELPRPAVACSTDGTDGTELSPPGLSQHFAHAPALEDRLPSSLERNPKIRQQQRSCPISVARNERKDGGRGILRLGKWCLYWRWWGFNCRAPLVSK